MTKDELEQAAQKLFDRLQGFQDRTLAVIGSRIKEVGSLSAHDQQALKNIADITGDMKQITKDLARVTGLNISEIEQIYEQVVSDKGETYKPLYDFRNMPYVPFAENEYAQRLVGAWAKQTANEMINLSRTSALGFVGTDGVFRPLQGAFQDAIDKAVLSVSTGVEDFPAAMRSTVEALGGSGVKTKYISEKGRVSLINLDSVIRANLLYGAKQAAIEYDEYIGRELECDGFEVDAHPNPRPTHEVIQGQMYAHGDSDIEVKGVKYKSENAVISADDKSALELLDDYGCLHFKTEVILGVSRPRYSKEYLKDLKKRDEELIEYDGKKLTRYGWKQKQRALERANRAEKSKAAALKAAGDKTGAKAHLDRAKAIRAKYDDLCEKTGMQSMPERMAINIKT